MARSKPWLILKVSDNNIKCCTKTISITTDDANDSTDNCKQTNIKKAKPCCFQLFSCWKDKKTVESDNYTYVVSELE